MRKFIWRGLAICLTTAIIAATARHALMDGPRLDDRTEVVVSADVSVVSVREDQSQLRAWRGRELPVSWIGFTQRTPMVIISTGDAQSTGIFADDLSGEPCGANEVVLRMRIAGRWRALIRTPTARVYASSECAAGSPGMHTVASVRAPGFVSIALRRPMGKEAASSGNIDLTTVDLRMGRPAIDAWGRRYVALHEADLRPLESVCHGQREALVTAYLLGMSVDVQDSVAGRYSVAMPENHGIHAMRSCS